MRFLDTFTMRKRKRTDLFCRREPRACLVCFSDVYTLLNTQWSVCLCILCTRWSSLQIYLCCDSNRFYLFYISVNRYWCAGQIFVSFGCYCQWFCGFEMIFDVSHHITTENQKGTFIIKLSLCSVFVCL